MLIAAVFDKYICTGWQDRIGSGCRTVGLPGGTHGYDTEATFGCQGWLCCTSGAPRRFMKIAITRPTKLYRYSERKWLDRSLRLGEFRLRPASDYKDMEGAAARTDDEQHRRIALRNPRLTHVRTGRPIIPLGDVTMSSDIDSDYLTLCLATIYSDHFYQDFEGSDACLIIHHPDELFARLYRAINSVLPPEWAAVDGPVSYVGCSKLGAPFMKPEKFLFQFEWRLVCLPIPSLGKCKATMVTIGSIEDIAEVVATQASGTQQTSRKS